MQFTYAPLLAYVSFIETWKISPEVRSQIVTITNAKDSSDPIESDFPHRNLIFVFLFVVT